MLKLVRLMSYLHYLPLASLMLAACTITPPPSPFIPSPITPEWQQHLQSVKQINQYQARGSFAYFAEHKKVYARFFWQQYSPQRYRLLLTNPLGGTELDLYVEPGFIQITDNKGQRHTSNNLDDTMEKLIGMSIPLADLRLWMLGLPGDSTQFQLTAENRLQQVILQVNDQQWHVQYQRYHTQLTPALPERMELIQGNLRIKLKIDRWILQ